LPAVIYLAKNLSGPKIFCSLSWFLYWPGIILFSSDLFLFTFFRSLIRNPSFPFPFFLFISSFSPFFDLWLGIRVLPFVIRSPLRRFCCPLLWEEGWGFSSWARVQGSLRLCLNMVFSPHVPDFDIWGKTNSCARVSVSGWTPIWFPRGARNNDDLETTRKISHAYS